MGKLDGKIALVTGASRGIGYFTALELGKAGAHVVAVARTVGGLEELDDAIKAEGGSATLVPLDLMDFDGIDRLGAAIDQRFGKLDTLVANAGFLGGLSPLGHIDLKAFDKVMATNVTANWRLVRSMDPLLRASGSAKAIFLGDDIVDEEKPFWGGYAQSKAALEMLAKTYRAESQSAGIGVEIFRPGPTRTALRALAMPGEDTSKLNEPSDVGHQIVKAILGL